MEISEVAIAIAVIAFCITQLHLVKVARKLIRKSNESWAQAHREIAEVKSEVIARVEQIAPKGGSNELDSRIRELEEHLAKSFGDLSQRIAQSFEQFGNGLITRMESITVPLRAASANPVVADPRSAQSDGVASRKANEIIQTIQRQAISPQIGMLQEVLTEWGQPDLADALDKHPKTIDYLIKAAQRDPRVGRQLAGILGGAPRGSLPAAPQGDGQK